MTSPDAPARTPRLAVLGTGVMAEAVLAGALAGGWSAADVVATVRRPERAAQLEQAHGVSTTTDNAAAVRGAGVVLVGVKPKDVGPLLREVGDALEPDAVVVSLVAGLPTAAFEAVLPDGTAVVRTMPNTPAQVGAGVTAISPGTHATDEHLALVERLLAGTGLVVRVAEKDQDAVSAVSGSGPAYVFYVVDALAEAGVLLGLTRQVALQIATQTVLGAGRLLDETGEHPAILREKVSSPGGTTVRALARLDAGGVRAAFLDALQAAHARSAEIAAAYAPGAEH
ncbi:pyrroline-5-carboxylate reductase [Luteimicrobium xylanilyticum]|uniref:Pyrroline-5-carboxylate reductase n=1 Tax=Luteimicrobium xylanilyticum TaxID=1133546 RepID=A0A5P9QD92_9MICO|nr:pyrroline-5-carboxylate reductase [Luteimicrobium xylanilyticum]QFU99431.1 Pyrroline-5-carboxylate reductase [Luteimicrobium xylanilyticum]